MTLLPESECPIEDEDDMTMHNLKALSCISITLSTNFDDRENRDMITLNTLIFIF